MGEVEALGGLGEGIVRQGGRVVFVAGALPGERVRYRPARGSGRHAHATLLEVLVPSAARRPSPCPHDHEGGCGGCSLLPLERATGAALKAEHLRGLLERAGLDPGCVETPRLPGGGGGWRNRARFQVLGDGRLAFVRRPVAGRRSGRAKIAIDTCPVLHPLLEELRGQLDGRARGLEEVELRAGPTTGERLVLLRGAALPQDLDVARVDASVVWERAGELVPLRGFPWVHEEIQGVRLRIGARSFFQGNTAGARELVRLVAEMAGDLDGATTWDLYAGGGLFALTALGGAARAIAVESDPEASSDLRENARRYPQVSPQRGEVASVLRDLKPPGQPPRAIVADPPRSGLGGQVPPLLAALAPARLVLLSCDPRSCARDLAALAALGRTPRRVVPVDLFPGSHHLETVSLLGEA